MRVGWSPLAGAADAARPRRCRHSGAPTQASLRSLRKLGCVRRTRNPVTTAVTNGDGSGYWIPGSLATLGPGNDAAYDSNFANARLAIDVESSSSRKQTTCEAFRIHLFGECPISHVPAA